MKSSQGSLSQGGAPFRLCLYFALNPGEELYTGDIVDKFGIPTNSAHTVFNTAVISGWLSRKSSGRGRGRINVYTAGPKLLEAMGVHGGIPDPA